MSHVILALGTDGVPVLWAYARSTRTDGRMHSEALWDEEALEGVPQFWLDVVNGFGVNANLAVGETSVRQHWIDEHARPKHIQVSGEWVWDESDALKGGRQYGAWEYTRKEDTTNHRLASFDRRLADRRPMMRAYLDDLHSADARADTAIHTLQGIAGRLTDRLEAALISDKGRLTESDRDRIENERLAKEIASVRALRVEIDAERESHFRPASRMRIAHALIAGHPLGQEVVAIGEYYTLAFSLSNMLQADSDRETKLDNMVANLSADHGRSMFDRLVPLAPTLSSLVDLKALYDRIVLTPPQFGSNNA